MPEIGEVARVVHYIHKHLVGKSLAVVKAQHDENVYGKVGTSAAEFEKALTGKKVLDARQQGKYFWLVMSSPPHPVFHFGMTGWWKIRAEETSYYKPAKPEEPVWPPKFWKFTLETAENPKTEAAFVDSRRFARIRLIDCPAAEMRNTTPLKENGPDPVIDKDILTEDWLAEKLGSKKVPIKALLLDQANISGIGNWVGDELLYDAKIHPEQYSNTLTIAQIKQLHKSLHYVCGLAVSTLSDSSKFPEEWLFKHRWGKGKKDDPKKLPNGASIKHITVGGRTSAIVPSVQKKTGPVAGDLQGSEGEDEDAGEADADEKPKAKSKPRGGKNKDVKAKKEEANEEEVEVDAKPVPKTPKDKKRTIKHETEEGKSEAVDGDHDEAGEDEKKPPSKKRKANTKAEIDDKVKQQEAKKKERVREEPSNGRRRSARVSGNTT